MLVMHADECNLMTDEGCVLAVLPHHGFSKQATKDRKYNYDKIAKDIVIQVRASPHTLNTPTKPWIFSEYQANVAYPLHTFHPTL